MHNLWLKNNSKHSLTPNPPPPMHCLIILLYSIQYQFDPGIAGINPILPALASARIPIFPALAFYVQSSLLILFPLKDHVILFYRWIPPRIKSSAVCNAQLHIQCELIWKKSLMFYSTDRMQAFPRQGSKVLVWSISGKRPCGTSLNKKKFQMRNVQIAFASVKQKDLIEYVTAFNKIFVYQV